MTKSRDGGVSEVKGRYSLRVMTPGDTLHHFQEKYVALSMKKVYVICEGPQKKHILTIMKPLPSNAMATYRSSFNHCFESLLIWTLTLIGLGFLYISADPRPKPVTPKLRVTRLDCATFFE